MYACSRLACGVHGDRARSGGAGKADGPERGRGVVFVTWRTGCKYHERDRLPKVTMPRESAGRKPSSNGCSLIARAGMRSLRSCCRPGGTFLMTTQSERVRRTDAFIQPVRSWLARPINAHPRWFKRYALHGSLATRQDAMPPTAPAVAPGRASSIRWTGRALPHQGSPPTSRLWGLRRFAR